MKYRFEHTFFYKDERMKSINSMLHEFGISGEFNLTGSLGHTDIIIDLAPGKPFVPLTDEQNETVRAKIEEIIGEKLNIADVRMTVKVAKGVLLG